MTDEFSGDFHTDTASDDMIDPLADMGLDDVATSVPDSVYHVALFDLKIMNTKNGRSVVATWKIMDDPKFAGETVDQWQSANRDDTDQKKRFLKRFLENITGSEDHATYNDARAMVGSEYFITLKTKGQYQNVTKIAPYVDPDRFGTQNNQGSKENW